MRTIPFNQLHPPTPPLPHKMLSHLPIHTRHKAILRMIHILLHLLLHRRIHNPNHKLILMGMRDHILRRHPEILHILLEVAFVEVARLDREAAVVGFGAGFVRVFAEVPAEGVAVVL